MRGRLPVSGSYTGNGSTGVSVDLGFRPAKVELWNVTDGDLKVELVDDGSDGIHFEFKGADSQMSKVTSSPAKINSRGFSTGTDADLIESAKVFRWVAF